MSGVKVVRQAKFVMRSGSDTGLGSFLVSREREIVEMSQLPMGTPDRASQPRNWMQEKVDPELLD